MSFLGKLVSGLFSLLCGSSQAPEQEKPSHQQQQAPQHEQVAHKPHEQQQHAAQHAHYPPAHTASSPRPHHQSHSPGPHKFEDDNQRNQQNEYYRNLRSQAKEEGDAMARCFQQSREVYSQGDGARAKELSNEGKAHQQKMEELNKKASDWIYVENNRDSGPGEIDLHGLYVKEAIAHTDAAIEEAKRRGATEIRLIVGKGLHSNGGAAKIRPAIEELMEK
ncbi:hypothetical protein CPB85DRAFT_1276204 [Mucidula mucida]|nr:hypothetical protein CPB85DRAFT_1276204 [Mucidula mucida]